MPFEYTTHYVYNEINMTIKPYLAKRRSKLIMVLNAERYNHQDIGDIFGLTRFKIRDIVQEYKGESERVSSNLN